ncbi:MAG: porin [Yokenella regensburgei]|uniref:Outer membrane porin PhoE n=1 Tax=Yokenella regensburgei TaxID=158877 RepID=A0AB38FX93_9ENTR|nr:porin [Yokenella regensburgei]KFD24094.1 outer membrane pore protein E [Yokenella regensburgei ATCC 49455]MDQ4431014.1 porin [Yokenella regensburgei]MDR2217608.1 porin [Yokenella regensburgei]MDR3105855.1 porin [Yokenella regensburgei]QIU91862.1 porin [Yokenella regensburgei]
MKKSTLALVVMGAMTSLAAQAAEIYNKDGNKLDLYGRVKAEHYMSDNNAVDGDQSYIRLGFKGATQINDQLSGYGQWEYQVAANRVEGDPNTAKTRLAFAGLKAGDYGSFDYGRNYGVLYNVAAYTDMIPEFGDDSFVKTDNFMTGRGNGMATYRNNNFFGLVDGLKLALQYQGKNENDARAASKANGDGFGTSLSYDFGDSGFTLGAAYANSDRTQAQESQRLGHGANAEAWTTGVKYDANNVYLAAIYAETRNMTPISGTASINGVNTSVSGFANKNQAFEVVAQYQFDFGLRPSIGYIQSKGKDIEGVGDADLVKYIDVAATYYFNKNMSAFVDYKINQLSDDNKLGLNNDDVVALGLVYQF